ncbi:serine/arginine repetitive matrix protein 1 isoform X1 [Apis laboriosa]|uniref:serine/arginine repetitive matrix protein 1 isoform X1 n=1 Tax=Apis laboriosa TaxID=183418 RepID=UPI001CC6C41E|nr:serine/arginine repetitive matrix protein 1 isoform X1 [Apis laboriosa]
MAYRGVKGSDPFVSKTSRNERFAQMSKQEQIIQQKKLEIQAKMQEQKAKEAVENLKKTNALAPNLIENKMNSSKKDEDKPVSQTINLFANDGSFLDQFKKIASNKGTGKGELMFPLKLEEKKEEKTKEISQDKERRRNNDRNKDWENKKERRREDTHWEKSSENRHSSSSSPSPTRRPASQSPEARRSFNQVTSNGQRMQHNHPQFISRNGSLSTVPSPASQPMTHLTGVPSPNMRNIVTNIPPPNLSKMPPPKNMCNTFPRLDDRPGDPRMQISSPHTIRPPPPPPPPLPPLPVQPPQPVPNTNIPPPNIHMSRTISSNLQSLPPPLPSPNPLAPLSSSSTSSTSSTSPLLLSSPPPPPPLLSLSSSSACSTSSIISSSSSSITTSSSSSSTLISTGLQLPSSITSPSPSPSSSSSLSLPSSSASSLSAASSSNQLPLSSLSSTLLVSSESDTRQHVLSTGPQCGVPPPAPLQPMNLPPPNIPPPNLLPTMTQIPPSIMSIPASQTIVVSVPNASNVPNVPNVPPPNVIPSVMMSAPPPVHNVPSSINSVPPPNLNIPPPNVPPPSLIQNAGPPPLSLMSTSYPLPNQVAQVPMGPPNIQVPPPVRPLTGLRASEQLVCPVEAEQLARIVAECGDEIEQEAREKNAQDPKLWFLHQKQSAAYLQYRGLVAKFRADKSSKESKNSGAELYCPEEALSDNDDSDQGPISNKHISSQEKKRERENEDNSTKEDNKEERKRKRRSRWGDPDNKVPISEINTITTHSKQQSSGNFSQPGIAIPGQIGQPAVIIPPPKVQRTETKNPMLTKISRNDPALIQYARQTFGTLDLTEEQWKKAEDHYKINLLYQNLLRKREEVRRLEAQGKHKYEYDSDEETEGGTWEHKLRSAEMEATQMWAEELTAQAEGKHHIGDFLPPDELKKFMEQYNAVKQGKEPDLSDYKEYKLKEDNIGFQMLQKLGWSEGQGLGSEGNGRIEPINKATNRFDSAGLGSERPDGVSRDDDEFDAYRKRMMLAYRFRPNPLNNPRRPYY